MTKQPDGRARAIGTSEQLEDGQSKTDPTGKVSGAVLVDTSVAAPFTAEQAQTEGIESEMPPGGYSPAPKVVPEIAAAPAATVTALVANPGSVAGLAKNEADFMSRVVPWPAPGTTGYVNMHWTMPDRHGMGGQPFTDINDFMNMIPWCNSHPRAVKDVYFCLSQQAKAGRWTMRMNLAPTSLPSRQTTLNLFVSSMPSSSERSRTNSSGTSNPTTYSRTPPSEMPRMRQSRGAVSAPMSIVTVWKTWRRVDPRLSS